MRYGINARIYAWAFTRMLKDYYQKHFPEKDRISICKAVNQEYKAMVLQTPGIGGQSNGSNHMGPCNFFQWPK